MKVVWEKYDNPTSVPLVPGDIYEDTGDAYLLCIIDNLYYLIDVESGEPLNDGWNQERATSYIQGYIHHSKVSVVVK